MSSKIENTSPKLEYEIESLNYALQMAQFDPAKHLKNKEKQYVHGLNDDIKIVRETEEGWWRESIDVKGNMEEQIKKLREDKTVAIGWFCTPRFGGNGGWS